MPILVVEDDASIRETLGMILEADGHDHILVKSGEDALEYLAATHDAEWPDVLMLDLTLPGLSGDEVFAEIERRFGNVPRTILMTAAMSGAEKTKNLKGSLFLPKPFTLEQLQETLEKALRTKESLPRGLTREIRPNATYDSEAALT